MILSKIYTCLHEKCPLELSDFNEILIFSSYCLNIHKYYFSWKSVKWEPSCSMRTADRRMDRGKDRQIDKTKLTVAFRKFANSLKEEKCVCVCARACARKPLL